MSMLRFYFRLARQVPSLIRASTSRVQSITSGLLVILTSAPPWLAPWFARYGLDDLAAYTAKVPRWWSAIPVSLFVMYSLLKANCALHAATEGERDSLASRLDDRRQRHADADELGRLRKTMRKRYYQWIETNMATGKPTYSDGEVRASEHQNEIAKLLEIRYGYDITDRFLTAKNADSDNPYGLLLPAQEYAGRIGRLGAIIRKIRSGKIRRRVV
jgi:hypothetical protein